MIDNRTERVLDDMAKTIAPLTTQLQADRKDARALMAAVMAETAERIAVAIEQEGEIGSECSAIYRLCADVARRFPEASPLALWTEE